MKPGNEDPMAGKHAVSSDEEERQHDENTTRDIHISNGGSETAMCLLNILRVVGDNTIRARIQNTSSSSTVHVSLEYLADEGVVASESVGLLS